jgi:hypothetical protein
MASFLETLSDYQLASIAALTAIIGNRLYPVEAPQGVATPHAVYTQIGNDEDIIHSGKTGWGSMRVQYEFYAMSFPEVHDAARALRAHFEGVSREIATGIEICFCRVETELDRPPDEERIYSRTMDLLFEYNITA